jgi:hypothetical protein
MIKRVVAGIFWFLAVGYFWNYAGAMWGFPPAAGSVLALAVALFMSIDPLGVLWKREPSRRIARIPEPTAPADGKRVGLPGA